MKRIFERLPSPAMMVACAALFVALSGASYAALVLPANSVKSPTIKNGEVKAPDIGANAVNGAKIADGSVKGAEVDESTLAQVPSAASADSATNASHASTADSATSATNAANATGLACSGCVGTSDLAGGAVQPSKLATDEGWHEIGATGQPAFENGWTNYGSTYSTAAYYRDKDGVVHLKGLIKGGTVGGNAFTVPYPLVPLQDRVVATLSNDALGRVRFYWLGSSTRVYVDTPSTNAWVSLDNLEFRSTVPGDAAAAAAVAARATALGRG